MSRTKTPRNPGAGARFAVARSLAGYWQREDLVRAIAGAAKKGGEPLITRERLRKLEAEGLVPEELGELVRFLSKEWKEEPMTTWVIDGGEPPEPARVLCRTKADLERLSAVSAAGAPNASPEADAGAPASLAALFEDVARGRLSPLVATQLAGRLWSASAVCSHGMPVDQRAPARHVAASTTPPGLEPGRRHAGSTRFGLPGGVAFSRQAHARRRANPARPPREPTPPGDGLDAPRPGKSRRNAARTGL